MTCVEKCSEIISEQKRTVRQEETVYRLSRISECVYNVSVSRGENTVFDSFQGDFFDIVELYKTIVETDTLPENIADIAQDYRNR